MKFKIKIIVLSIIVLSFSFSCNCFAANDFTHTLALAKHSSCSYIAEKFDALSRFDGFGNFVLKELKKKEKGLFPWRFEVTNGYQEGFVYYALLGYANEISGDIPFAYRCYQNSLACIDENKSFDHPLPRAEIYLAIGRTCLAAGRYMDAKDWLDNAFLEAGDNLQLQAAIDRVLIRRANEIGDYPEIIFLYQHLLSLANDNKSPPLKGETGGCKLTKKDYANYSQILFYSRKDREGFSKLLEGISKLGIDNNLGVKDPLVDKFLNNIMRADDDEVKWFYDLLGWAIVDARAKAGDEDYLAFLCNARTLFCKVYDFLNRKDDLKKVKERIDVVKEQLAEGVDVFGEKMKKPRHSRGATRNRKNPGIRGALRESSNRKIINGEMEKTPGIILDDLLMLADWKLKQRNNQLAETNYFLAYQMATGTFANLEYDGTTMENVAKMGMIQTKNKKQSTKYKFVFDNSFRAAELTLQLYLAATNDEQRAEFNIETAFIFLPQNYKLVKRYINQFVLTCNYKNNPDEFIEMGKKILAHDPYTFYLYPLLCKAYVKNEQTHKVYNILVKAFKYNDPVKFRISHFKSLYPELSDNQMQMFLALLKKARITQPTINTARAKYRKIKVLPINRILLSDQFLRSLNLETLNKQNSSIVTEIRYIHPNYLPLLIQSYLNENNTNLCVSQTINYLSQIKHNYPPSRLIPILKNTEKLIKKCRSDFAKKYKKEYDDLYAKLTTSTSDTSVEKNINYSRMVKLLNYKTNNCKKRN